MPGLYFCLRRELRPRHKQVGYQSVVIGYDVELELTGLSLTVEILCCPTQCDS